MCHFCDNETSQLEYMPCQEGGLYKKPFQKQMLKAEYLYTYLEARNQARPKERQYSENLQLKRFRSMCEQFGIDRRVHALSVNLYRARYYNPVWMGFSATIENPFNPLDVISLSYPA